MKKLLFLLLLPLLSFGQSQLDFSRVNTVTQVGDTLVVKYQFFKGDGNDATLYQFDIQYNNKLLTAISQDWQTTSTSAQKAINSWNGYKFSPDATKDITDYDGQYTSWLAGAASYGTNADWSVDRITYQDVTSLANGDEFIKISYKIKDKGLTNYTDYSNLIQVNWANYKESNGTLIDVTKGAANQSLSLTGIQGGAAGNVALNIFSNVITNNIGDGTDYGYTIYTKADYEAGIGPNTTVVASGQFDASGQATVSGLENDTEYAVMVSILSNKTYLDEAVTVSDLALIFREAIGTDINGGGTTFDYAIQKLLGNVYMTQGDSPFTVNFQDSYEVLAYLQGVNSGNQAFISKTGQVYNVSGVKSTFGDKNANGYPTFSPIIKPTDTNKSFDFGHGLAGDVNFSHSFQPTSQLATMAIASQAKSIQLMSSSKYVPLNANVDLVSELVNGKVVFSINSEVEGMVGSQFNIEYDKTRIKLDDVVFDTGNTMTNFSNLIEEGKVRIGSFDQNFESTVKSGTPYKLIFTPLVQLNNTSGLVTFKVKEGVKADGTQIKFIMN